MSATVFVATAIDARTVAIEPISTTVPNTFHGTPITTPVDRMLTSVLVSM